MQKLVFEVRAIDDDHGGMRNVPLSEKLYPWIHLGKLLIGRFCANYL